MPIGVQTMRGNVKAYCAQHKMTQSDFGQMLGLSQSSFRRFMGAGRETTGNQSESFRSLSRFFQKQKREEKKASSARFAPNIAAQNGPLPKKPGASEPVASVVALKDEPQRQIMVNGKWRPY
jgi:hypothetical protein